MTATVFYDDPNEIALLTNTFLNSSGTPADPTTVSCVVTDPTGATGDPANGHATMVTGSLKGITGLSGFGIAIWNGTKWARSPSPDRRGTTRLAANVALGWANPSSRTLHHMATGLSRSARLWARLRLA